MWFSRNLLLISIIFCLIACGKHLPKYSGEAPREISRNDYMNYNFSLQDVSGNVWGLSRFKKKVIVIQFFSVACKVCIIEAKAYQSEIVNANHPDIDIVGIAIRNSKEQVSEWQNTNQISYPILLDESGLVFDKFKRINAVPTLVFLTPERKVHLVEEGYKNPETLKGIANVIINQSNSNNGNVEEFWDKTIVLKLINWVCEDCTGYDTYFKDDINGVVDAKLEIVGKDTKFTAKINSYKISTEELIEIWKKDFNISAEVWNEK